jgi:hypothetical protein
VILQFADNLGVRLGTGYISASNDSTLAAHYGPIGISEQYVPTVSAVPVTLSFHYFLPLGSSLKLHFFAGPGLYFSSVKLEANTLGIIGALEAVAPGRRLPA